MICAYIVYFTNYVTQFVKNTALHKLVKYASENQNYWSDKLSA